MVLTLENTEKLILTYYIWCYRAYGYYNNVPIPVLIFMCINIYNMTNNISYSDLIEN